MSSLQNYQLNNVGKSEKGVFVSSLAFHLRVAIFFRSYTSCLCLSTRTCVQARARVGVCLREERESTLRKAQAMLGSSCGNTKALQSHITRRGKKTSSKHFKILIISETEVQTSS